MLRDNEFWQIYSVYMEVSIEMSNALIEYKLKYPAKDLSEQYDRLDKIKYLGDMIHKLYHMNLKAELAHGEFIAERKRLMDLMGNENYHLKKKVKEQESEIEHLKTSIQFNSINKQD
jgi:hypothetical protein